MNISIRGHIIENFKNDNEDSIRDAITSSISENDEIVLPGLGVFFSLLYENCDEIMKRNIVSTIKKALENTSN